MSGRRVPRKPKPKTLGKVISKQTKQPASTPVSSGTEQQITATTLTPDGASSHQAEPSSSVGPGPPQGGGEQFENELVWCIEQLQIGIANSQAHNKKVQDAVKILKILENPKAPYVKKRQAMRSAFGDYRKLMAADEKKYAAAAKKMKIEVVKDQPKSCFIRKSQSSVTGLKKTSNTDRKGSSGDSHDSASAEGYDMQKQGTSNKKDETETNENIDNTNTATDPFHFTKSDNSFRFNFPDNTDDLPENPTNSVSASKVADNSNINSFTMEPSKENFSFNFPNP